jgi:hypothetical protein
VRGFAVIYCQTLTQTGLAFQERRVRGRGWVGRELRYSSTPQSISPSLDRIRVGAAPRDKTKPVGELATGSPSLPLAPPGARWGASPRSETHKNVWHSRIMYPEKSSRRRSYASALLEQIKKRKERRGRG